MRGPDDDDIEDVTPEDYGREPCQGLIVGLVIQEPDELPGHVTSVGGHKNVIVSVEN
ncbi:hypothetical protein [Corynebacterium halotolerans]|uniref:hypothetical protein n=1 Tax=Corynebacterium halotolerans TaxID=225326 RepID=UPI0003471EE8|nr:hypothetical protein [Corynebacterium halotolerans]